MSLGAQIGHCTAVAPPAHNPQICNGTNCQLVSDPVTGQILCKCQVTSGYSYLSRMSGLPENLSGLASFGTASPFGAEGSAFHQLNGAAQSLGLDRASESWKSMLQHTGMTYQFDPVLAAHPYNTFYPGLDLNSARRKNATRETTSALKAWLYEHRKNPYPTKAEKIMLAIITKMTLTQVSTWFANARRRLKKECKVGWSSSDKDDDKDGKDCNDSDSYSSKDESDDKRDDLLHHGLSDISDDDNDDISGGADDIVDIEDEHCAVPETLPRNDDSLPDVHERLSPLNLKNSPDNKLKVSSDSQKENIHTESSGAQNATNNNANNSPSTSKPKIWSISEIIQTKSSSEKKSPATECRSSLTNNTDALRRSSILQYDSSLSWRSQC